MTIATTLSPHATGVIAKFEPISLEEVESQAALTERHDRKYLVDPADLAVIIDGVASDLRALEIGSERSFAYESIYFDTPDYSSYMAAAHRRPRRFKVRTRNYLDSQMSRFELKTRQRDGLTVKHRMPYPFDERESLNEDARAFLDAARLDVDPNELSPVSQVRFRRSTLVDTGSWSRITIDTGLSVSALGVDTLRPNGFVVVETKSVLRPTAFDQSLWLNGYRPTRMSKYCTLMAAIHPSLPANHWNRTLRRHFDWEPHR